MCKAELHRARALAKHAVVPIAQRPRPVPLCSEHSRALELYCNDDQACVRSPNRSVPKPALIVLFETSVSSQMAICHYCQYHAHKGHNIELLEVLLERQRQATAAVMVSTPVLRESVQQRLETLRSLLSDNTAWASAALDRIDTAEKRVGIMLHARSDQLKGQIRQQQQV